MRVTGLFFLALALLFAGMIGMQVLGHRFGRRRAAEETGDGMAGSAAIEASLFALLGLLVAFTFSGADTRLDARRHLIVAEANAIGTAYLRLDLLPERSQPTLRDDFRRYVDSRLVFYDRLLDLRDASAERAVSTQIQRRIWRDVLAAADGTRDARATLLLVPAVNEMIDLTTARDAALRTHAPAAIFVLLVLLSLACAFMAGIGMSKSRRLSRVHTFMFAIVLAVTAYVILNLEFPRAGFLRLRNFDAFLVEVRAGMD
jgi:hypothetical protein